MSRKTFAQGSILVLLLLAFLAIPVGVQAGGVCGGTYIVEQGQTVDAIAAICGTTASAIYAANPGISASLYTGQALTVPGGDYSNQSNIGNTSGYNYYNSYNYNYPPVNTNGNYIVQYGDTFSGIASRFGVSVYALWAANPNIWDINLLYAGQVIYVPTSAGQANYAPYSPWFTIVPTPTQKPTALSVGTVPAGTPTGEIKLSNQANGDVYVSLQGTTRDGIDVIREYPVSGTMNVNVPAGWYIYVAWVGGHKFEGQFNLPSDSNHSITFYSNKVVVE